MTISQGLAEPRKVCRKCKLEKLHDEFTRYTKSKDGRRSFCRSCASLDAKLYHQNNRERVLERERNRYHSDKNHSRDKHLRKRFKITLEQFNKLLEQQHGVCAICGGPPVMGQSLHVDHDHQTGQVRGLLCGRCNTGIGLLGDTEAGISKALEYFRKASNV